MGTLTPIADLAKAAFRVTVQPALFVRKRRARYAMAGVADALSLPVCRFEPRVHSPTCDSDCANTTGLSRRHFADYRHRDGSHRGKPWLGTASALILAEHDTFEVYARRVGERTKNASQRLSRRAARAGYVTGCFHPPYLVGEMNAVLSSKRFRSGGLVPYGLFGSRTLVPDHGHVPGYRPQPPCPLHWTLHWGVFSTRNARGETLPHAQWTLAGFAKLRRAGNVVHVLRIMTHGEHFQTGANDLMHLELVRWMIENPEGVTGGVTHYVYGALEHAGDGLADWKLRRWFKPVLIEA